MWTSYVKLEFLSTEILLEHSSCSFMHRLWLLWDSRVNSGICSSLQPWNLCCLGLCRKNGHPAFFWPLTCRQAGLRVNQFTWGHKAETQPLWFQSLCNTSSQNTCSVSCSPWKFFVISYVLTCTKLNGLVEDREEVLWVHFKNFLGVNRIAMHERCWDLITNGLALRKAFRAHMRHCSADWLNLCGVRCVCSGWPVSPSPL